MELDNANPTIVNPSELPSYRERRKIKDESRQKQGIRQLFMGKSSYAIDPFYLSDYSDTDSDDSNVEPIDEQEIYDLIAPITDPEHPFSLASLGVVKLEDVHLGSPTDPTKAAALSHVLVELTPTVTHCSLATVIGLCVRVRLDQALPPSFRVEVKIKSGTHNQSEEVNKQLADKERVAAALENAQLMGVLRNMMKTCLEP
ncbi:Fe-S cluster assembly (FSCA) [Glarea lozoyensis ATCC 20868]|uniref:Fe-S cluster assembly (FSCA) n=1 Tax=Glarea lozoyensis (strain ATCC 20868 / MF5171) TaxID=1116229 RepID=S3ECK0_GLAL2|nr:Fe-S cluster assembly (FSCA) [Glarea lozoyensis ATCC 20868]EPE36033.1 Fe-S cluster assembly (FSCA) [Glarea lozoyensis ATCC 20868]